MENKVTTENYPELAMRTCLPSSKNDSYAKYGFVSEVFELFAKIYGMYAKKIRDGEDFDKAKHIHKIADELGDVCWFEALLSELKKQPFSLDRKIKITIKYEEIEGEFDISIIQLCGRFGLDSIDILQRNVEKLASRKERGVLKGNGDER